MTLKDKVSLYEQALERISLRNVDAIEKEAQEARRGEVERLREENTMMESILKRISKEGDDKGADMASCAEYCLEWLANRRAKEGGKWWVIRHSMISVIG
mgnify:CR=1 FL=1